MSAPPPRPSVKTKPKEIVKQQRAESLNPFAGPADGDGGGGANGETDQSELASAPARTPPVAPRRASSEPNPFPAQPPPRPKSNKPVSLGSVKGRAEGRVGVGCSCVGRVCLKMSSVAVACADAFFVLDFPSRRFPTCHRLRCQAMRPPYAR